MSNSQTSSQSISKSSEDLSKSSSFSSPEANFKSKTQEQFTRSPASGTSATLENDFIVRKLGILNDLPSTSGGPLDVINLLDIAQQEGDIQFVSIDEEVVLSVSTQGIKISSKTTGTALLRIPIANIERIVSYDDGIISRTVLAVKVVNHSKSSKDASCNIYAYQCEEKADAQKICKTFGKVLEGIISMINQRSN